MVRRGGGLEDVRVRDLGSGQMSVDLLVNVCDSMGANLVNSICEHVSGMIEEMCECRVGVRILSNLCL